MLKNRILLYAILHEQFTQTIFIETVLLEYINERYQSSYTIMLSYDDCSIRVYRVFTTIFHERLILLLRANETGDWTGISD